MDVHASAAPTDLVTAAPSPAGQAVPGRGRNWTWETDTDPFSDLGHPDKAARFVVEQITDKDFRIPEGFGFQYNPPEGGAPIEVTRKTLPKTDFASIPRYMSWLVGRHGRHTPAALVHDVLVTDKMSFADRKRADTCFRDMMDDLEVPPVLSRVMWAAVTLATRRGDPRARVGIYAWAVVAVLGLVLLVWGAVTLTPWMILAALLAPFAAAGLWGKQFWAGLVAGLALPVVAVPAAASLLGYWAYWLIERGVKGGRARFGRNRAKKLPAPVPYQGR